MKLSIIVINYNSETYLRNCIESIRDNLKGHSDFEILVIDNNSHDESLVLLEDRFPHIRILKNSANLGFVKAANLGIANTKGEYILILNPDIRFLDKNILSMVAFLDENPSIGICGPLQVFEDGSAQSGPSRFNGIFSELKFIAGTHFINNLFRDKKFVKPVECDYVFGSSMLIRRTVFETIGLFDENIFMFAEEEEFCFRAKRKGWKVYFYPSSKVIHYGQKSSRGLEGMRIVHMRMSALYYYSKRYNRFFMILMRMLFIINTLMRIVSIGFRIIFNPKESKEALKKVKANLEVLVLILKMKDSRHLCGGIYPPHRR